MIQTQPFDCVLLEINEQKSVRIAQGQSFLTLIISLKITNCSTKLINKANNLCFFLSLRPRIPLGWWHVSIQREVYRGLKIPCGCIMMMQFRACRVFVSELVELLYPVVSLCLCASLERSSDMTSVGPCFGAESQPIKLIQRKLGKGKRNGISRRRLCTLVHWTALNWIIPMYYTALHYAATFAPNRLHVMATTWVT